MNFPRTLVIGIDGATFDLLKPWADAGLLPTFAHLLKHGAHASLDAFPHMNSAAAWTNLVTGYNPAQHSIFHFISEHHAGNTMHPVTGRDRREPAFWHTLANAGQRVGVMNVPISFPAENVNGFMVSGMDTPDMNLRGFAQPKEIFQDLSRAGIEYIVDVPSIGQLVKSGVKTLPRILRDMTTARTRAFLHLLKQYPCDSAMLVYVASDRLSHYFWQTTPPLPDAPEWEPLRELFQLYDRELETLLAQADRDTTVFLLSDHGFGALQNGMFGLNTLLRQLGYQTRQTRPSRTSFSGSLLRMGRQIVPLSWQSRLAQRFPDVHSKALRSDRHGALDWTRTRAEATIGGALKFNTTARSVHGIVTDETYGALWSELAEVINALTDPESDKPIVSQVHPLTDFYRGPYSTSAPDLLTRWNHDTLRNGLAYRRHGHDITVFPESPKNDWTGTHYPNGIFIAYGKGIRPGIAHATVSHFELAPTLLYLHDQPIVQDMDGRVLTDWFEPDFVAQHSIKTRAASEYTPRAENLNAAENDLIESRLRQLGYIE